MFIQSITVQVVDISKQESTIMQTLEKKKTAKSNNEKKLARLKESVLTVQKKIYAPVENQLGNDTLFFTLYSRTTSS